MDRATEILNSLAEQMEPLAEAEDAELAHGRADDLLVEAVLRLGSETPQSQRAASRLIDAYRAAPKWYS